MFRRRLLGTALAAAVLLSACTNGGTPDDSRSADTTASASPTPTVSPEPTVTVAGEPADSSPELEAGTHLELAIDGGEFTAVELVDTGNDRVPADDGELTTPDPAATTTATGTNTDTPAEDATGAPASETTEDAEAGGTTEPTEAAPEATGSADPAGASATETATATATAGATASDSATSTTTPEAEEPGTLWTSDGGLAGGKEYVWTATAVTPDGAEHEFSGTVTTTAAEGSTVRARSVLGDDAVVGVAAPIVIDFASIVDEEYRDDVEQRLAVEATDADGVPLEVEGSWAWLPDKDGASRIHYRTKEYWPAYTDVSVSLPFEGVQFSADTQGSRDMTLDFEIGREQIVEASAETKRMVVTRDGEEIWDWPTSLGSPEAPSFNGPHIVMSKAAHYVMTSERWGYETPTNWAVRIHNNGEFVHGAPWSASSHGVRNVSHGCINLTDERAYEYYQSAIYGDPVNITGSSVDLTIDSGEVSDWVYTWDQWTELSALS